jgi:hypothetical protein
LDRCFDPCLINKSRHIPRNANHSNYNFFFFLSQLAKTEVSGTLAVVCAVGVPLYLKLQQPEPSVCRLNATYKLTRHAAVICIFIPHLGCDP